MVVDSSSLRLVGGGFGGDGTEYNLISSNDCSTFMFAFRIAWFVSCFVICELEYFFREQV